MSAWFLEASIGAEIQTRYSALAPLELAIQYQGAVGFMINETKKGCLDATVCASCHDA